MDYKPIHYTTKSGYVPVNDIYKMDPRPQLYKPKNPITPQDMTKKPRTYDTKPPKNINVKPYGKAIEYNSYREYVPPWSRNKVKVKNERPPPKAKPEKKKPDPKTEKKEEPASTEEKAAPKKLSVAFASSDEPSMSAAGSIMRSLVLFGDKV